MWYRMHYVIDGCYDKCSFKVKKGEGVEKRFLFEVESRGLDLDKNKVWKEKVE